MICKTGKEPDRWRLWLEGAVLQRGCGGAGGLLQWPSLAEFIQVAKIIYSSFHMGEGHVHTLIMFDLIYYSVLIANMMDNSCFGHVVFLL